MKRKISFIGMATFVMALCLTATVLCFGSPVTAYAKRSNQGTDTTDEWSGKVQTGNLITIGKGSLVDQGWNLGEQSDQINSNAVWYEDADLDTEEYDWGIRALKSSDDIGLKDYTKGVWYPITLSEADRVKADKGDLKVYAWARYYKQTAATHYISLKVFFYDEKGTQLDCKSIEKKADESAQLLSIVGGYTVPKNTASMRYYVSNWGSLSARPFIGELHCSLWDQTGPRSENETLDNSKITDVTNNIAIAGDTVKYYVEFDEKISVESFGTSTIELDGNRIDATVTPSLIDENGKGKICYTFVLPELDSSGTLKFGRVSGLSVKDEGGNSYLYSCSALPSKTIKYYKTMNVGASMTNLTFTGKTEATYLTDYTATVKANTGYDLPASVSIKVGGAAIASAGYSYDKTTGVITVKGKYISGDISVSASGVAKKTTVTFDRRSGTGGSLNATATYDAAMPTVDIPSLKGYTFTGYYSKANGQGVKYYDEQGKSAKNCDFFTSTVLYANWVANSYTVKYSENKPSSASSAVTGTTPDSAHTYDKESALSTNGYSLTGWTFLGWARAKNATSPDFSSGEKVENLADKDGAIVTLYAVWQANSYTLTFDTVGGSFAESVSVRYDGTLPAVSTPTRKGYNFGGYFTRPGGVGTKYYDPEGNATVSAYKTVGDTRLYAYWIPVSYNIEFYSEGKYVGVNKNVVYGSMKLPSAEDIGIKRDHYNFVGWNIYDNQNWAMYFANTAYNTGLAGVEGETVTLYAAWAEKSRYTINFDSNGGTGAPATEQVYEGETITLSDLVPARKNYTFLGWSDDVNATQAKYLPGGEFTMGGSVVTLYAVWKHNPSLTYDANGGKFALPAERSYPVAGERVEITSAKPSYEGYSFIGWSENKNAASASYRAGDRFIMPDGDTVLYAVWRKTEYVVTVSAPDGYSVTGLKEAYFYGETVTFDVTGAKPKVYVDGARKEEGADGLYSFVITGNSNIFVADGSRLSVIYSPNGGYDAPSDNNAYNAESIALISEETPTRTGYSFRGWSTREYAVDVEYSSGGALELADEDVVLYAVWEANVYTISYDANGGTGSMDDGEFSYGTVGALSGNTFEKTGHTFLGWALSANGEAVYDDGVSVADLCSVNNGNVTLYAVWEQTVTEITFRSDDGTEIASPMSVAYGEELTSEGLVVPARTGYIFNGYRTQREGLGELIFDAELNVATGGYWNKNVRTLTLYPHWTPISYTVIYMNGQKEAGRYTAVYGKAFKLTSAASLGITAKEGYRFVGWSASPSGLTVSYADEQNITASLSHTDGEQVFVYAVFAENQAYSVIYYANGGSNAPVDKNLYFAGDTVFFADMIPEREGYVFCGWSYDPNKRDVDFPYEGYRFTISSVEMREGGLSLYAVWKLEGESLTEQIEAIKAKGETLADEIESLKSADGDLSDKLTQLGSALKDAQDAIDSLGDTYVTHEELETAVNNVKSLIEQAKTALQEKIEKVQENLDKAVGDLSTTIEENKNDIEAKLKAVDEVYKAAKELINADITALREKDVALEERIAALEKSCSEANVELKKAIEKVQENLDKAIEDLNATISGNKSDIEAKLKAVDDAYKAADKVINADITALKEKDTALEERIAALEKSCSEANAELKKAIEKVQENLDKAVGDLSTTIEENKNDIEAKLKAVDDAYKAADKVINADITALKEKDTALEERIAALEKSCSEANAELKKAIEKVQENLDNLERQLKEKDKQLESSLNALIAANDKNALICLIINIILGIAVAALIVLQIVKAVNKKKSKE